MAIQLPTPLQKFIKQGGVTFHCSDGDWDVDIREKQNCSFEKELPAGAVMIADNGSGDCLFLKSSKGKLGDKVFVYWHEEERCEVYTPKIADLLRPASSRDPEPTSPTSGGKTSLQELEKALARPWPSEDSLARLDTIRDFKESAFGMEALPVLRKALTDRDVQVVIEAAACIAKLGRRALESAANDRALGTLDFQLFVIGSRVWEYSLCANAYSACLDALLRIEADEDLIVDYIGRNISALDGDELIQSLQALRQIGSKEAKSLIKRAATFWLPELNARERKAVGNFVKT